jgi:hypothetical protein
VVRDVLRPRRPGVVEQRVEPLVVLVGPGAQVVGPVEDQAQPDRVEDPAQGGGVPQAQPAVAEHRAGRRVHLHPAESGGLEPLEHRRGRPPPGRHVQAQARIKLLPARLRAGVRAGRRHAVLRVIHDRNVPIPCKPPVSAV